MPPSLKFNTNVRQPIQFCFPLLKTCFSAPHVPGPLPPQFGKPYATKPPALRNIFDLFCNVLLAGALDVDVLDVAGGVVAADGLPEVGGDIGAGAVDDEWVEEHSVALLHVQVNPREIDIVVDVNLPLNAYLTD